MLSHVSVDQQNQDTGVEELGGKHSVGNGGQLFTVGVFSYPGYSMDYHIFENQVDRDDDEGH